MTAISPLRNQKNILKKMSQSTCENGIEIIQLWIARMWTARSSEFSVTSTNIYFRKLSVCLCEKRKDNLHSGKNKEPKKWIDSTDTKARGSASTLRAWKCSHNLRERERVLCKILCWQCIWSIAIGAIGRQINLNLKLSAYCNSLTCQSLTMSKIGREIQIVGSSSKKIDLINWLD